jgi:DNA replication protein DnaC
MFSHPTLEKLLALRLFGMARAFEEQLNGSVDMDVLTFEERLGLLVDREMTERDDRRLKTRLRQAKLRHSGAAVEDLNYRRRRGLDRSLMTKLVTGQWIREKRNILMTGPTGIGKSWIACALGQKACRDGWTCQYLRAPRLFKDLEIARGDGSYRKHLLGLARKDVLILDDWGLVRLGATERQDLLEIMEDRYDVRSTIVTSQVPVKKWHEVIGDPTFADAILDRLIHNAYRIDMDGESFRKNDGADKDK